MSQPSLLLKGERCQIWHYDDSDMIYIHTNGRCVGVERSHAEALYEGLGAVLRGETKLALTPDMVEKPREASVREYIAPPKRNAVPTLEDI